jgi:uncharacterized membrane protein
MLLGSQGQCELDRGHAGACRGRHEARRGLHAYATEQRQRAERAEAERDQSDRQVAKRLKARNKKLTGALRGLCKALSVEGLSEQSCGTARASLASYAPSQRERTMTDPIGPGPEPVTATPWSAGTYMEATVGACQCSDDMPGGHCWVGELKSGPDAAAMRHRVNNWDPLRAYAAEQRQRAERAEARIEKLTEALREVPEKVRETSPDAIILRLRGGGRVLFPDWSEGFREALCHAADALAEHVRKVVGDE